jgi:hypothetical protein
MLGYDFPLLSLSLLIVMILVGVEIVVGVIWAFIDNFRRHDHHGWAKAGWALLLIVFPLIGMLIYIAARPADVAIG